MPEEFMTEDVNLVEKIPELTAEQIAVLEKSAQIAELGKKFLEYPDFVVMSDSEKISIILSDRIQQEEAVELESKRVLFEVARSKAVADQKAAGLLEVEATRTKVYKDKVALQQKWNTAASNGYEIPE